MMENAQAILDRAKQSLGSSNPNQIAGYLAQTVAELEQRLKEKDLEIKNLQE